MKVTHTLLLAVAVALLTPACAPFTVQTAPGMVELDESRWSPYDTRMTTPDGVVVATRAIRQGPGAETPRGDLAFWREATILRFRTLAGYALVGETEVTSVDGTDGVRLELGRDQDGTPYRYDVVLFVTPKFVHVIEAGGRGDLFEASLDRVEAVIASYRVRR